jgi:predicted HicB family RNase H-like nuclease
MTKKPTSLSDVMAKKATTTAPPKASPDGETRTLTLRLPPMVHDQLREMAFTSRKSQHALLLEALNLLFERHGKPPIAL